MINEVKNQRNSDNKIYSLTQRLMNKNNLNHSSHFIIVSLTKKLRAEACITLSSFSTFQLKLRNFFSLFFFSLFLFSVFEMNFFFFFDITSCSERHRAVNCNQFFTDSELIFEKSLESELLLFSVFLIDLFSLNFFSLKDILIQS